MQLEKGLPILPHDAVAQDSTTLIRWFAKLVLNKKLMIMIMQISTEEGLIHSKVLYMRVL